MHLIEKANTISIKTDSKEVAEFLEKITEVKIEGKTIPVQVFRTYGNTYSKGVIYDIYTKEQDPQDDVLNLELESEKTHVVAARRLGKCNTAVLTFDDEKLPRSVLYGKRYMRVFPYKPKAVTCTNCHRIGHKPDICPNATVCATCGNHHDPNQNGCLTPNAPFCQGCKKAGHLGTDRACPTWQGTNKTMREEVRKYKEVHKLQQQREIANREVRTPVPPSASSLWADLLKEGKNPAALPTLPPPAPEVQELRNTCAFLKAELDRLKAIVQVQQEENNHYKSALSQRRALTSTFLKA